MRQMREVPEKITPSNDDGYFEELTKAIFRAGFSWPVIRQKWENFRIGFDQFNVTKLPVTGVRKSPDCSTMPA